MFGSKPQMSSAEFNAALKRHGFRVVRAKIEDATGKCPGVSWSAVFRGRTAVDYNKTLAKVIAARNTELARRGLDEIAGEPVKRIFSSAATSARSRTLARRTSTGPTPVWMARCGPWPCWRMLPARRLPARSGRPNRDCRKRDIRSRPLRNPHFVPRHRKYASTTRLGVQTAIMPSASN
jgi:hypothetical protein